MEASHPGISEIRARVEGLFETCPRWQSGLEIRITMPWTKPPDSPDSYPEGAKAKANTKVKKALFHLNNHLMIPHDIPGNNMIILLHPIKKK